MEVQNNNFAWLYKPVAEFLIREAAGKAPLETGGILMGYFSHHRSLPVILRATGPGPRAVHQWNYYQPDTWFDESEIATIYIESGRHIIYLGDWHTHLTSFGGLSYRDRRTLQRIARCKSARVKTPLMLILSFNEQWDITIWQGEVHKRYIWNKHLSITKLTTRLFI